MVQNRLYITPVKDDFRTPCYAYLGGSISIRQKPLRDLADDPEGSRNLLQKLFIVGAKQMKKYDRFETGPNFQYYNLSYFVNSCQVSIILDRIDWDELFDSDCRFPDIATKAATDIIKQLTGLINVYKSYSTGNTCISALYSRVLI